MPKRTTNYNLYKYDTSTDGNMTFNIDDALNDNFDSIDALIKDVNDNKQNNLVSGTNIKTINSESVLGSGNIALQTPLVSGETIKTINDESLLGSGNLKISHTPEYSFNSGNVTSGNADLIDATLSQDTEYSEAGTYTFEVQTAGYYPIVLVGGGGGGRNGYNSPNAYGGSGAAFVGEVYLNTGSHNIVVGGYNNNGDGADSILYDENGNVLITAGGGKYATSAGAFFPAYDGAGGTLTIATGVLTQNVTVQSNGGTGASGSKYNGYGQGGYSTTQTGRKVGYFSIVLPSASSNVSYKVGGSYPALTGTLADGKQFTLNGLNSDDITGLADGTYIKYSSRNTCGQ